MPERRESAAGRPSPPQVSALTYSRTKLLRQTAAAWENAARQPDNFRNPPLQSELSAPAATLLPGSGVSADGRWSSHMAPADTSVPPLMGVSVPQLLALAPLVRPCCCCGCCGCETDERRPVAMLLG